MKNSIIRIYMVRLFFVLLVTNVYTAKSAYNNMENLIFNQYFTLVDSINLNIDNLLLGDIGKLLVLGKTNKIVIDDYTQHKVFLIDLNKRKYKEITLKEVMPGYKISVDGLLKERDNGFSISRPPYFYFKYDNEGKITDHFAIKDKYISDRFAFIKKPYFVFLSPEQKKEIYTLNLYNYKTGELKKLSDVYFNYKDFHTMERIRLTYGLLIDGDNNIYITNSVENKIYKYDKYGNLLMEIKSKNKRYKQMPFLGKQNFDEVMKIFASRRYDHFISMYFLNKKIIITKYLIDKTEAKIRTNIELFDKDTGESILGDGITSPLLLLYAEDNYIYVLKKAKHLDENGNLPNPIILKYKYNGIIR